MDFYRSDPRRMPIPSTIPVTTITTGISLSDRFKQIQHEQDEDRVYSQDGYGIPSTSRFGGGRGRGMGGFGGRPVPKAVSQRNRQLALALAKRARGPQAPTPLFRNRGVGRGNARPVQSRLGIARGKPTPLPLRGVRRGLLRNLTGGRGLGLNRVQKAGGAISRNRNQGGQPVNRGGGQRGGRGSATRGGARGRGRGGRGAARGGGSAAAPVKTGPVSKEALDSELDSYMANSKAYLDKQLDDYMMQAKAAAAAVTAGTVPVEETDVSMADA